MRVTEIEGIYTLSNGKTVHFSIGEDQGWQQWGADTETLSATVDITQAIAEATDEHMRADGALCFNCKRESYVPGDGCTACGYLDDDDTED